MKPSFIDYIYNIGQLLVGLMCGDLLILLKVEFVIIKRRKVEFVDSDRSVLFILLLAFPS